MPGEPGLLDLGELVGEHQPHFGILVADIDVDVRRLDHPGGDQHAFDEAVGIAFEIMAVLEGAGLALVGVDRHQAGRRLGAHQRPFAAGREAGAAQAAQSCVAHRLDDVVARARARSAGLEQRVAAVAHVTIEIVGRGIRVRVRAVGDRGRDALRGRPHHLRMADGADRRTVAGAHARRAHDAHVLAEPVRQRAQKMLGTGHGAGKRIAHAHGDRGRRRLALLHHVEMGVEGRDLVHLRERELHLLRERGEMRGGEMAVPVLDQMQMLDEKVAPPRPLAEKRAHLVERLGFDLAALGGFPRAVAPPRPGRSIIGPRIHAWNPSGLHNNESRRLKTSPQLPSID